MCITTAAESNTEKQEDCHSKILFSFVMITLPENGSRLSLERKLEIFSLGGDVCAPS